MPTLSSCWYSRILGLVASFDSLLFYFVNSSFTAPEVLETLDTGDGYTQEVDLWGVGVILYILLCGFPPFYGDDDDEIYDKICEGYFEYPSPYWDNISDDGLLLDGFLRLCLISVSAKDLIDHLLVLDPKKRYTSEQVLSHKWITDNTRTDVLGSTLAELKKFNARRKLRVCASISCLPTFILIGWIVERDFQCHRDAEAHQRVQHLQRCSSQGNSPVLQSRCHISQ
jgi:serine/threonine protein kinase